MSGFAQDIVTRIVNVHWGSVQQGLVGVHDYDTAAVGSPEILAWIPPFYTAPIKGTRSEKGVSCGASGFGYTVYSDGFVAFGGGSFMVAHRDGKIELSVDLSKNEWVTVWDAPGVPHALSYANEAFFLSYESPSPSEGSRLAVSFDGVHFPHDVLPFGAGSIDDQLIYGGAVAYSPETETYATVGQVFIRDPGDSTVTAKQGYYLIWATSPDGITWSSGHAKLGQSPMSQNISYQSLIAYGNGVFVAAGSECTQWISDNPFEPVHQEYVLTKCAVAVSTNGKSWSIVNLPGARTVGTSDPGDYSGYTVAVGFVLTKPPTDGYFIAVGFESGQGGGAGSNDYRGVSKIWVSASGSSSEWSLEKENNVKFYVDSLPFYGAISAINPDPGKVIIR